MELLETSFPLYLYDGYMNNLLTIYMGAQRYWTPTCVEDINERVNLI